MELTALFDEYVVLLGKGKTMAVIVKQNRDKIFLDDMKKSDEDIKKGRVKKRKSLMTILDD